MRDSTQSHGGDLRSRWVTDHPLATSLAIYLALCVPAYVWLQGPVGTVGTVDEVIVLVGLALGAILIVPVIRSGVVDRVTVSRAERFGVREE